jgi:tetratricopeptide (TPR) repeat protein
VFHLCAVTLPQLQKIVFRILFHKNYLDIHSVHPTKKVGGILESMDESRSLDDSNSKTIVPAAPSTANALRKWIVLAAVLVLLVLVMGGASWFAYQKWQAAHYTYTIPGVPSLNLYDSGVLNSRRVPTARAANLIAIMQYWGDPVSTDDQSLVDSLNALYTHGVPDMVKMKTFFAAHGYKVYNVSIQNTQGLEKYITQKMPVPLLFSQVPEESHLNVTYQTLLIGIDISHGTVTLSDFYRGQNYTQPISTFEHLWGLYPFIASKGHYLAIYPLDPARISARVTKNATSAPYTARTAPMTTLAPLLPTYALYERVERATTTADVTEKLSYLQTMTASPLFTDLHPVLQTIIYTQKGSAEMTLGQKSQALTDIQKAISLDQHLNAPFAGWGQFAYPQISAPYSALADYYKQTGAPSKATAATAQAIKIIHSLASSTPTH